MHLSTQQVLNLKRGNKFKRSDLNLKKKRMVLNLKTILKATVDKIIRILATDIKCYFYLSTG